MSITRDHPLVGRRVVYTPAYRAASPQEGVVTSVNPEEDLVFVCYGLPGTTSRGTPADRVTVDGVPAEEML